MSEEKYIESIFYIPPKLSLASFLRKELGNHYSGINVELFEVPSGCKDRKGKVRLWIDIDVPFDQGVDAILDRVYAEWNKLTNHFPLEIEK